MRETPDIGFSTGAYVSGGAHAAIFAWVLIGGFFIARDNFEPVATTDVSLISSDEFAALSQPAPQTSEEPPEQVQPQIDETVPEVESDAPVETPEPPPVVEQSEPDAVPEQLPEPLAPVEVTPNVTQQPEAPVEGDVGATLVSPETEITPERAPRVAPEAAPEPEPEVRIDEVDQAPTAQSPEAEVVQDEQEETAREAASEEIVTEADQSLAPTQSARPSRKPTPPPTPQVAEVEPAPEEPEEQENDPLWDSIDSAVSEAIENAAPSEDTSTPSSEQTASAPTGPPLTSGERDGFRLGIQRCWNVGALSTEAIQTVVVVGFAMNPDGTPDIGSIQMISATGDGNASRQAYEAGRRAIIRCGANGYGLPADKYEQWKDVEVTFDASQGLIR